MPEKRVEKERWILAGYTRYRSSAFTFRIDVVSKCVVISGPDVDPRHEDCILVLAECYGVVPVLHGDGSDDCIY